MFNVLMGLWVYPWLTGVAIVFYPWRIVGVGLRFSSLVQAYIYIYPLPVSNVPIAISRYDVLGLIDNTNDHLVVSF